jgi:hypothetical protein
MHVFNHTAGNFLRLVVSKSLNYELQLIGDLGNFAHQKCPAASCTNP